MVAVLTDLSYRQERHGLLYFLGRPQRLPEADRRQSGQAAPSGAGYLSEGAWNFQKGSQLSS